MLKLQNMVKKYEIGQFKQTALNGINLSFREQEFVAILGPSGSGKTTLLNMVGGLDRYDEGDLLIGGKSTRHFTDQDWDSYRNHAIGFVFQSYNLISHISVLDNVELGMTLSGKNKIYRTKRALEVLDRVGLKDHVQKRPNQLSGGQMQRVAIARALANDPEIILADEPTGAIDSATSKQIMELIQEIAKDKLVIMVTHDEAIAKTYANRIVSLRDGKVTNDTNPYLPEDTTTSRLSFKRTAMSFLQAIKLSYNNLKTKKFRTLITAFAGSIGIIGVALVLSLANGLNNEITRLEMTTLAEFPIQVDPMPVDIQAIQGGPPGLNDDTELEKFPDILRIFPFERTVAQTQHFNTITDDYVNYVKAMPEDYYHEVSVSHYVSMPILFKPDDTLTIRLNTSRARFEPMLNNTEYFRDTYDILAGDEPSSMHDLILIVDEYNRLDVRILSALGLGSDEAFHEFEDLLGMSFKTLTPNDTYQLDSDTNRFVELDLETQFDHSKTIDLSIVAIVRVKEDAVSDILRPGLKFSPELSEHYLSIAQDAPVGVAQENSSTSVITGLPLSEQERINFLRRIGYDNTPQQLRIYPVSFEAKENIREYLDAYNEGLEEGDRILYTDLASIITELTSDVIDGIAYVLIAFSAISLIVSSIMIGIITYVSVLERTKEIGILRSLGARKKDISRVFNAETSIIGFVAGSIGVLIAYILTFPINYLISSFIEEVNNLAVLPLAAVFILVAISIFLTYISSLIPARMAARKDPVEALRVE